MKKWVISVLIFLSFDAFSSTDGQFGMSIGLVDTEYKSGSNVLSYYSKEIEGINFRWNFIDMNLFSRDIDGYNSETLSNGNEICRDESSGQFSDESNCSGIDIDFATSIELNYLISSGSYPLSINLGARILGDKELGGGTKVYTGLTLFSGSKKFFGDLRLSSNYSLVSIGMNFSQLISK